jgi:hypothetical protein
MKLQQEYRYSRQPFSQSYFNQLEDLNSMFPQEPKSAITEAGNLHHNLEDELVGSDIS